MTIPDLGLRLYSNITSSSLHLHLHVHAFPIAVKCCFKASKIRVSVIMCFVLLLDIGNPWCMASRSAATPWSAFPGVVRKACSRQTRTTNHYCANDSLPARVTMRKATFEYWYSQKFRRTIFVLALLFNHC